MAVEITTRSGDYVMDSMNIQKTDEQAMSLVPRGDIELPETLSGSSIESSPNSSVGNETESNKRRRCPTPSDEEPVHKRIRDENNECTSADTTLIDSGTPQPQPPSKALYITNLMWPVSRDALRKHLGDISSEDPASGPTILEDLYIDRHRTHAFAVFPTVASATLGLKNFNGQVWPSESSRKPLNVEYIPEAKVQDWITTEVKTGRRDTRWRIELIKDEHGIFRHVLTPTDCQPPANAPSGPKDTSGEGFNGKQRTDDQSRSIVWTPLAPELLMTTGNDSISFQTVSDEYVEIRRKEMDRFYDPKRRARYSDDMRDINRFSFAHSIYFVDRGHENFVGIRPDTREKDLHYGHRRAMQKGGDYYTGSGSGRNGVKKSRRGVRGGRRNRELKDRERARTSGSLKLEGDKTGDRDRQRRRRNGGSRMAKADSYKPSYDSRDTSPRRRD